MACATDFYRCGCGAVVKCRTTCTQCLPAKRAAAEARARAEFSARKERADREQRALEERKQAEARAITQTLAGRPSVPARPCVLSSSGDIAARMNSAFAEATNPALSNDCREDAVRCYCIALRERLTAEGMTPQRQDPIVVQHSQLISRQLQANRVSKRLNDAREARGMSRLDTLAELAERAQQTNQGALAAAMARQQQAQADLSMQGQYQNMNGALNQGRLFNQQMDAYLRSLYSG